MATKADVKAILKSGKLTGQEAARIVVQHYVDQDHGRGPLLTANEIERVKKAVARRPAEEIAVYDSVLKVYRIAGFTLLESKSCALEIRLRIEQLRHLLSLLFLVASRGHFRMVTEELIQMFQRYKAGPVDIEQVQQALDRPLGILADDMGDVILADDRMAALWNLCTGGQSPLRKCHHDIRRMIRLFLGDLSILTLLSDLIGVKVHEDMETWQAEIEDAVGGYTDSLKQHEKWLGWIASPFTMDDLAPNPKRVRQLQERMALPLGDSWWDWLDENAREDSRLIHEDEDRLETEVEPNGQSA